MSKLSPVYLSELVRKLKALDFEGPFSGVKHLFMIKGDLRLTVPNPHRQDIGREYPFSLSPSSIIIPLNYVRVYLLCLFAC